jgi:hypothetical protein
MRDIVEHYRMEWLIEIRDKLRKTFPVLAKLLPGQVV